VQINDETNCNKSLSWFSDIYISQVMPITRRPTDAFPVWLDFIVSHIFRRVCR